MLLMISRRIVAITRWTLAFLALAGIVLVYRRWLPVSQTTVALTLLLYILILASRWSLRLSVAVSLTATLAYNFFFLPPFDTLSIADPQNWLALFAFLATSVIGSRLSQRARHEAEAARARQREVEVLFQLSREMLQTEHVATLLNALPSTIARETGAPSVALYLLQGDRLYQTGSDLASPLELPHLRQVALTLAAPESTGGRQSIPLRAGVRPRGLLLLHHVALSLETLQAIGSLVSIAIDRAQALEDLARGEAAKESERLRTLMIDSITHELRTPLTSIKGAVTTLLAPQTLSQADRTELLTIVDEESDRLNNLVSQAVEMAQLESQQIHMSFRSENLLTLVEAAREACSWVEAAHPLSITVPPAFFVLADPEFLIKVLCNLLGNAAKYSAPQSPIFVSAEASGEAIAVSVADRGRGIDAAEQSFIFDRFYRAQSNPAGVSGTGMGLAISRSIVEAHSGRLSVTSQPGQGSVFTFTLPVAAPVSAPR